MEGRNYLLNKLIEYILIYCYYFEGNGIILVENLLKE